MGQEILAVFEEDGENQDRVDGRDNYVISTLVQESGHFFVSSGCHIERVFIQIDPEHR